jgi:DNA repair exonuclease SbcCD ATPase subunit
MSCNGHVTCNGDESVMNLQEELRLMRMEQWQSNGRALVLIVERDEAREQLSNLEKLFREKELEHEEEVRVHQEEVAELQRRLDTETQRLVSESVRLCAQLERAMAAKKPSGASESEASQEKEKEMDILTNELALLRKGMKDSSAALAGARQREADLSETIAKVRDEMQVAREGMEAVMRRDAVKELEVENLKRDLAMVGDERDVLKEELHRQQLQQQYDMDDALQELHEAGEEATRAKEELVQVSAARDRLSSQVAELTRVVDGLESLKREAERDIEAKENEILRLGHEVDRLQEQGKAAAEAAREELSQTLDSLAKVRQQLSQSEKENSEQHALAYSKISEFKRALDDMTSKAAALEEDVRNAESRAREAVPPAAPGAPLQDSSKVEAAACQQCEAVQETCNRTARELRQQVGSLKQDVIRHKQEGDAMSQALSAARTKLSQLEDKATEVERVKTELENQRLRHNEKQREQLEKMSRERSKISEEMRSAFKELTARQHKLDLCKKLVTNVDWQLSTLLETSSAEANAHVYAELLACQKEGDALRLKLNFPASPRMHTAAAATAGLDSSGGIHGVMISSTAAKQPAGVVAEDGGGGGIGGSGGGVDAMGYDEAQQEGVAFKAGPKLKSILRSSKPSGVSGNAAAEPRATDDGKGACAALDQGSKGDPGAPAAPARRVMFAVEEEPSLDDESLAKHLSPPISIPAISIPDADTVSL